MALQHPVDFHPRHLSHPFGFGFGLTSPSTPGRQQFQSTASLNSTLFYPLSSHANLPSHLRAQKRRLEDDDANDFGGNQDRSMDRSPTPERQKRAAPKRARVAQASDSATKDESRATENKAPANSMEHQDVDVGMLLGMSTSTASYSDTWH